jgi:hypothetical protein
MDVRLDYLAQLVHSLRDGFLKEPLLSDTLISHLLRAYGESLAVLKMLVERDIEKTGKRKRKIDIDLGIDPRRPVLYTDEEQSAFSDGTLQMLAWDKDVMPRMLKIRKVADVVGLRASLHEVRTFQKMSGGQGGVKRGLSTMQVLEHQPGHKRWQAVTKRGELTSHFVAEVFLK